MKVLHSKKTIRTLGQALQRAFQEADLAEDIISVFQEAADGDSGDSGGGAKWHSMTQGGYPGAKFHAMGSENTKDLKGMRRNGRGFREHVVLDHPDYYLK